MPGATGRGLRIKSGRAIAIVLGGPVSTPHALSRHIVELSDPQVPETRQPYHHGFGTHEEDPRAIARRVQIVERCAAASVAALITTLRQAGGGGPLRRAALVVGSVIDPAEVANPHIRAHAHEGRLFRVVVEDALRSHGIDSDVLLEKTLGATASSRLRRSDAEVRQTVAAFARVLGSPWRLDEKAAATAAWLS